MKEEALNTLSLSQLRALCRNRGIKTTTGSAKPSVIQKLVAYHKKKGYKELQFQEKIDEWKKDELVTEAKAIGTKNPSTRRKADIAYKLMNNGKSPTKTKSRKKANQSRKTNNDSNKNKKKASKPSKPSKPLKKTKLRKKQEAVMTAFNALDETLVHVFQDLQDGFKPIDETKELPHPYTDYQDKLCIPEDLGTALDSFGDKLLVLLPLILEAQSIVHDFEIYTKKVRDFVKKKKSKGGKRVFYIGMKQYKKKKQYKQDEVGPICGVYDDKKGFDEWRNKKEIKKDYGKISMAIYKKEKSKGKKDDSEMEMESEDEEATESEEENLSNESSDGSVASVEKEMNEEEDMMVSSDEDESELNHDAVDGDQDKAAEIVVVNDDDESEDDKGKEEMDEDEDENEEEVEVGKKNKSNIRRKVSKKPAMIKATRSRRNATEKKKVSGRKRKRQVDENEGDEVDGTKRKRAKLNHNSGGKASENEDDMPSTTKPSAVSG